MTAATVPSPSAKLELADPPHRKPKVGFADLIALTVRQHRLALSLIVLVYVLYGLLVQVSGGYTSVGDWRFDPKIFVMGLAGLVALFWGAPLLATEYEQHTTVLVWSQDVSPVRWLLAKLTLLGGLVVVLSILLNLIVRNQVVHEYPVQGWSGSPYSPFGYLGFETWVPLVIAYALFGFAFGVVVGALCRRTVTAMGITLVGFAAVRFLIATELRSWVIQSLFAPLHRSWPLAYWVTVNPQLNYNDYEIDPQVWLNAAGQSVPMPNACWDLNDNKAFVNCATSHGITRVGDIYQPYSRLDTFQSVELAVYAVLIAVCLGIAVWSVRRRASI